jgi:hypothetical protein
MTGLSSDAGKFEEQTATIPETIAAPEGEVIPPGEPAAALENGWPIFDVQQILALPFFLLSRRYGELWRLDEEEEQHLARAWKPILDRYLPLDDSEWATAALVTLAIIGPRALQTDWDKGEKKPAAAASSTPRASTRTAASGESVSISGSGKAESPQEWGVFSNPSPV